MTLLTMELSKLIASLLALLLHQRQLSKNINQLLMTKASLLQNKQTINIQ